MEATTSRLMSPEAIRQRRQRKMRRAIFITSMIIIPVIQFLIFYVYINFSVFPMAFKKKNLFLNTEEWVGWDNFRKVFQDIKTSNGETGLVTRAILNSLMYFILNTFIQSPMTVFLAFFFIKKMPGHKLFRFTFLLPSLIPGIVLPMLYAFMLDSTVGVLTPLMESIGLGHLVPANGWLGTYGTAQGMILFYCLWCGSGVGIGYMAANMNRIPQELFECAKLDGIGIFRELVSIVIPLIMPVLTIGIVTGINTILGVYMPSMLITKGGPGGSTKTIAYIIMDWTTGGEESVGAAAGLLFSAVSIPLVFTLKYFLERITPEVHRTGRRQVVSHRIRYDGRRRCIPHLPCGKIILI